MTTEALARVLAPTAAEIHASIEGIDEAAAALLAEGMSPAQYLSTLVDAGYLEDALTFLAYGLPRREGVYWGVRCMKTALGEEFDGDAKAAVDATEAWLMGPTDEKRRALKPLAEKAGYGTPVGCAALAGYFSGGSITPAEFDAVEPAPTISPKILAGGLKLSAVANGRESAPELSMRFLEIGAEIANSPCPWEVSS